VGDICGGVMIVAVGEGVGWMIESDWISLPVQADVPNNSSRHRYMRIRDCDVESCISIDYPVRSRGVIS